MKTKKIYVDWKKLHWKNVQWKAQLKAAIPGIAILVVFSSYFLAEDLVEKSRDRDPKLPLVETGETVDPPLDTGANVDPDNPPPVPPGPEREKFDAAEKAEVSQKKDMSLTELRALSLDKREKQILETAEARFAGDASPSALATHNEFLRSLAAASPERSVYFAGTGQVGTGKDTVSILVKVAVNPTSPEPAAAASEDAEPAGTSYTWQLRSLFRKQEADLPGLYGTSQSDGEGMHLGPDQKHYLVTTPSVGEADNGYISMLLEFPAPGAATAAQVELLNRETGNWEKGTVQWAPIRREDFFRGDAANAPPSAASKH